jgi:capping protein (actin filament) muscle Z-line, beta
MYAEDGKVVQEDATNKSLSPELKKLEKALNEAVSTYASLYYGSDSITSAYIENETENGDKFLISILIKKSAEVDDEENDFQAKAVWDSVHLFEITKNEDDFVYFHTATVMLSFDNSVEQVKNINLSGNLIRQNESKFSINKDSSKHLIHVGSLLEESESRLRNDLQSLYFGRTHDIVNELRSAMPEGYLRNQADFRDEMMAKLGKRNN